MTTKKNAQQDLQKEVPAIITDGQPGDPQADQLQLIDDKPDVVRMDLRKFNKTKSKISEAVKAVKAITAITSLEQVNNMTNLLKALNEVEKGADAKRKELGDPYRLEVERVNKYVKDLVKDVAPAVKHGKDLILAFHRAEELKAKALRIMTRVSALGKAGFIATPRVLGNITVTDWKLGADCVTAGQVEELPDDIYISIVTRIVEDHRQSQVAALQLEKEGAEFFGDTDAATAIEEMISESAPVPAAAFRSVGTYAAPAAKGLIKRWVFEVTASSLVPREYLIVDEKKIREAVGAGVRSIPGVRIYQDESITLR